MAATLSTNDISVDTRVRADDESAQAPRLSDKERTDLVRDTHRNDLRRILGAIFAVYGVVVTAVGIAKPAADVAQTGGIAINVWTGIGMILASVVFFAWDRLRPVPAEDIISSAEASLAQSEDES